MSTQSGQPQFNQSFAFQKRASELGKSTINLIRVAMFVGGLVAVILGAWAVFSTAATLNVIAVLFGLYFLVIGAIRVVTGLVATGLNAGARILDLLLGVLVLVAGIFMLRNPDTTLVLLSLMVGIAWIIEGVASIAESADDSSRWVGIVFGVISILAGIVVLSVPMQAISTLAIVAGIFLIVAGISQLFRAFRFGRDVVAAL
ncbi:HdeD family acid-resistance protein [Homoserinimonas sp. OAct 916]|uniref:HdeD family acid-resistance protein n=1 Tax=Homoserinimonas sp. OAct 916 TaxID=2211450 RepID=UPI000DBE5821|nr:DUF308 domain-containing protein [Homoserinimonas sp. OAct 916]